jgi:hypothetical protein
MTAQLESKKGRSLLTFTAPFFMATELALQVYMQAVNVAAVRASALAKH